MKTLLYCCVSALLFCTVLSAGVVTPDGSWQSVTNDGVSGEVLIGSNVANAYWNKDTWDATNKCANVGCFITQKSYFTNTLGTPGTKSPKLDNGIWLGKSNGGASLNFGFEGTTGGNAVEILVELAGYRTSNWMGWYDTDYFNPSTNNSFIFGGANSNYGTHWGLVFDGDDGPDYNNTVTDATKKEAAVVTTTQNFGFWFLSNHSAYNVDGVTTRDDLFTKASARLNVGCASGVSTRGAMFTNAALNKTHSGTPTCASTTKTYDTSTQYFSLFAENEAALEVNPTKFWVGVEDLRNGDWDYNDMIFSFGLVSAVPEPGFYGALALGLSALFVVRSRRK